MRPFGIRSKLIAIFLLIKVLPLVVLAWFAWKDITSLGSSVEKRTADMITQTRQVVGQVTNLATENSIRALDLRSREAIERLTTDTARAVADFLHQRDSDLNLAATLPRTEDAYRAFLAERTRPVVLHKPWVLSSDKTSWTPSSPDPGGPTVSSRIADNSKDFHSRPPEPPGIAQERPLYLEMTFVGLDGKERVKVTTSDILPARKRDVSDRRNTWCKAETWFDEAAELKPGEIHVSRVIGPYLPSPIIGPYTPARAAKRGIAFEPEKAAYAGKENPVGKRFQGLIRWVMPVEEQGRRIGYVTLALDHTHVMEFTDHLVPTEERYSPISDAFSGNYAFMWDFEDRNISHPRDFFIVGYDPETGLLQTPWLEQDIYDAWQGSGLPLHEYLPTAPVFRDPSLKRKPAPSLTRTGLVGLHCRYLNFAPQCAGWHNLTQYGGSGSFVIFWSGLWKLTTAASIPYRTGQYATPKGFGYVTIGANVHEFHRSASQTAQEIKKLEDTFEADLEEQKLSAIAQLEANMRATSRDLTSSTAVMVVIVIIIAVWMASALTRRITDVINAINDFQQGKSDTRMEVRSADEMGQLAEAVNAMADSVQRGMEDLKEAESKFRAIFESAVEGIFQATPQGRYVRANPAMAHIFGYDTPEQLMDEVKHIRDLYVDPTERDRYIEEIRTHGGVTDFKAELYRKDGSTFWGLLSSRGVYDEQGELLYAEGMIHDVTEEEEARTALLTAKDAAEAASRIKSDFLSMVSHELRTPLTSVVGFAKIIRKKIGLVLPYVDKNDAKACKAGEQAVENLDVIVAEGERLTSLINDVLDLSKLEAGKVEWDMTQVLLSDVIQRALAGSEVLARQKGLTLRADVPPHLPEVTADPNRLIQVLINLLSNAVKFTDSGSVTCSARHVGDHVEIAVADTGRGIAPEYLQSIFKRFRQLGEVLTDKPQGSGLGLAICREIVQSHGGEIRVESTLGQGSVFTFTLPLHGPE